MGKKQRGPQPSKDAACMHGGCARRLAPLVPHSGRQLRLAVACHAACFACARVLAGRCRPCAPRSSSASRPRRRSCCAWAQQGQSPMVRAHGRACTGRLRGVRAPAGSRSKAKPPPRARAPTLTLASTPAPRLAGGGRGSGLLTGVVRGIMSLGGSSANATPQDTIRALEAEVEGLSGLCK